MPVFAAAIDNLFADPNIARDATFALAGAWLWWRPRSLASLDRLLFR